MKAKIILFSLALILAISGCSAPEKHPGWPESWTRVGDHIGVEPLEGFSLTDENDAMSIAGIYYFTWTAGEGREITNKEGKDATAYDAQIYLLLFESDAPDAAIGDWISREKETYLTSNDEKIGDFTAFSLVSKGESPYTHGKAAFLARDGEAVSVELLCSESFSGDADAILTQFISGFHFE